MRYFCSAMLIALLVAISSASAKELGKFKEWTASSEGKGKARACWIYSKPIKNVGKYKKRGEIYALITHRPGQNIFNEVQFTAGYVFKKNSKVTVKIKKKKFQLFTDGDSAWVRKNKVEKALVKAMRSGTNMVVRGVSSRGTKTKDTYSLAGITSALKAIGRACRRK